MNVALHDGNFVPQYSSINHTLFYNLGSIHIYYCNLGIFADKEFDKSVRWPTPGCKQIKELGDLDLCMCSRNTLQSTSALHTSLKDKLVCMKRERRVEK